MTKYAVVTTFHTKGYNQYAQKFINTFINTWPKDITLYAYAEDCQVSESAPNLVVMDLHASSPELVTFKKHGRMFLKPMAMLVKIQFVVKDAMQARGSSGMLLDLVIKFTQFFTVQKYPTPMC